MAYHGAGDGWCFSSGGFAGHVKLRFINSSALEPVPPVPPVTPVGMGKSTRGVELEYMDELDERYIAASMTQKHVSAGRRGSRRVKGLTREAMDDSQASAEASGVLRSHRGRRTPAFPG
jgi:hypothetical protein